MKITQVELYEVEIPPLPGIARYFPQIYDLTLCRVPTAEEFNKAFEASLSQSGPSLIEAMI